MNDKQSEKLSLNINGIGHSMLSLKLDKLVQTSIEDFVEHTHVHGHSEDSVEPVAWYDF